MSLCEVFLKDHFGAMRNLLTKNLWIVNDLTKKGF